MQKRIAQTALMAGLSLAISANAQIPGQAASAAQQRLQQQVQAQAQQRAQQQVQAQAQQRAQQQAHAQAQAQVQAQAQQRIQADAARAAQVAQQAAAASQQAAAASQQAASASQQAAAARQAAAAERATAAQQRASEAQQRAATNSARVGVGASASNRTDQPRGNGAMNASAYARMGVDTRLAMPPGLTERDVHLFDEIFGEFNPFRRRVVRDVASETPTTETPGGETPTDPGTETPTNPGADPTTDTEVADEDSGSRGFGSSRRVLAADVRDFTTRLQIAARERRAEISEMRDRALATGDAEMLMQAQQVEEALTAFVEAQAQVEANTASTPAPGTLPELPAVPVTPETPVTPELPTLPTPADGVVPVNGSSDTDAGGVTTADGEVSP